MNFLEFLICAFIFFICISLAGQLFDQDCNHLLNQEIEVQRLINECENKHLASNRNCVLIAVVEQKGK